MGGKHDGKEAGGLEGYVHATYLAVQQFASAD
jgi:hypothetical protein